MARTLFWYPERQKWLETTILKKRLIRVVSCRTSLQRIARSSENVTSFQC